MAGKLNQAEHAIQKAICNYLHVALPRDAIFWAVPNGGTRPDFTTKSGRTFSLEGKRLKDEGVKAGVADLHILWAGRLIALEVKTAKGGQSKNQQDWETACTLAGGVYRIVRSVDEVKALLDMLGCTKRARLGAQAKNEFDAWFEGRASHEAKAGCRENKAGLPAEYPGAK